MSLYRFARLSALLAFAGKYRVKLFNIVAAIAIALTTAWLYADVANWLERHHPQWVVVALIVKTLLVYAALFFLLWQLRPLRESGGDDKNADVPRASATSLATVVDSPLDRLAQKPRLTSRKDAILGREAPPK